MKIQDNISDLLLYFAQERKSYSKGQIIFYSGEIIEKMGVVLKGNVQIEQNDFWGNRIILDKIGKGGIFAETYAITGEPLMVDVEVTEDCEIAFVKINEIMNGSDMPSKVKLSYILVNICSKKNLKLSQKIMFTSPKKIRERLTAYLSYQAKVNKSMEFDIPFDRQQLADYLNLERSAMSGELSKMAKEGLIETHKSHFVLKELE
ncbi:MAG: Crp/Fnr family transcriptional regulator [Treponema sp.]|nr:Crp/Fnr family transcriptional regulator [Treponema sp.]